MKEKGVKPWSKTMFMVPNGEKEGCQTLVKDNVYGAKWWVVMLDRKCM
jgi:hypothetical protein